MTPAEIALPMLSIIFNDFEKEHYFDNIPLSEFTIMDPTCGVGTLLIASAKRYIQIIMKRTNSDNNSTITSFLSKSVIGQDKVDRMVRLSKINSLLLGADCQNIFIGNSISQKSHIDAYKGKVDFIFTNPPFGAEYKLESLIPSDFEGLNSGC